MTAPPLLLPPFAQAQPLPPANAPLAGHPVTGPPPAGATRPAEADPSAGLMALLNVEAEARAARTLDELRYLAANETRKLTRARQIFVFGPAKARLPVMTISGLPVVDRTAPLVQAFEHAVTALANDAGLGDVREFGLEAYAGEGGGFAQSYPFRALLWAPMLARGGESLGGLLLAREQPWTRSDIMVVKRLAATYAHAQALLIAEPRLAAKLKSKLFLARRTAMGAFILAALGLLVPVPMTTLAPFEITPADPVIVSAPLEGVIEDVLVEPSAPVAAGQSLVRFTDTALRNRLDVAEREVAVAEARLKQATQVAFNELQGRHDMSVARSEFDLKVAERDFARDMFARTLITAPRAGVAVYADKRAMVGRPVAVGERLMQIADPAHVEATIDVAVGDALALQPGASVKLYLDSDPIDPRAATVVEADYQARPRPGNVLAYRVVGALSGDRALPRLGARGTAQIYGDRVMLAYYLFRRPLAALRQWAGL